MNFAANIRNLRKDKGWTQSKASTIIGIKASKLGSYEEGRAFPRKNDLHKFITAYAVPHEQLYNLIYSKYPAKES